MAAAVISDLLLIQPDYWHIANSSAPFRKRRRVATPQAGLQFVQVYVQGLSGHLCTTSASSFEKVSDLKERLANLISVPVYEQQLVWCGSGNVVLQDADPVFNVLRASSSGLSAGLHLTLVRNDAELYKALDVVTSNGFALARLAPRLQKSREVVLAAVARHGLSLGVAAVSHRADREVVLTAVAQDGYALQFADQRLSADRQVVATAVARQGRALQFAAPSLQRDEEVIRLALSANPSAVEFITR